MFSKLQSKLNGLSVGGGASAKNGEEAAESPAGKLPALDAKVEEALRKAGVPLISCQAW